MTSNDLISLFGKKNIFKWIFELPNFYIKPRKYFDVFFKKRNEEKISIIIFYTLINILFIYVFSHGTLKEISKSIITEFSVIFVFITLYINKLIVNRFFRLEIKTLNVLYLIFIIKLLFIPIMFVSYFAFIETEIYEYLFLYNSVLVISFVFVLVYSNLILYKRKYPIIVGVVLNVIIFNILIVCSYYIRFDNYIPTYENSARLDDPIRYEFDKKLKVLDSLTIEFPLEKFLIKSNNSKIIIYSFENDSIISVSRKLVKSIDKTRLFKASLLSNLEKNKNILDSLEFQRNKELYIDLISYLNKLKTELNHPISISSTILLDKKSFNTEANGYCYDIWQLSIDNQLYLSYIQYLTKKKEYLNSIIISEYPNSIGMFLLYPAYFFTEKLNGRLDEKNDYP